MMKKRKGRINIEMHYGDDLKPMLASEAMNTIILPPESIEIEMRDGEMYVRRAGEPGAVLPIEYQFRSAGGFGGIEVGKTPAPVTPLDDDLR